jgi:hypothetical protein
MLVPQEEMYNRLKDYNWIFNGAEYDLYSSVEIDEKGRLTFQINRMVFTLDRFIIRGSSARINASCDNVKTPLLFTFTGTSIQDIE